MDWLPTMLDAIFVLGQVSAGVGLAYGACLSLSKSAAVSKE
jgi:hypothetical protein